MQREYLIRTGGDAAAESARTLILNGRRWRSFNTALGEWSRARGRPGFVFDMPIPDPLPPLYCRSLVTKEPPFYAFHEIPRQEFLRETWPHGLLELIADLWIAWPIRRLLHRISDWWTAKYCAHEGIDPRPMTIEASYETSDPPADGGSAPRK